MNTFDKHFFMTSHQEVNELVKPLIVSLQLKSFVYQKNFNNGEEIRLGNQPEWLRHFYAKKLYQQSIFEHEPKHYPDGYVVWEQLKHHNVVLDEARCFDISHGMTLSAPCHDGVEYYFFGLANQQQQMMSPWLRNIDLFRHFIAFFHDRGGDLLKRANKHRLCLEKQIDAALPQQESVWTTFTNPIDREKFFAATPIRKLRINEEVSLSQREFSCARLLLQGMRAKEIAGCLYISSRTVEVHLAHLREKLHCANQSQLIKVLYQRKEDFII